MITHVPCCHIPCDKPAEWEILNSPFGPEDNTLSCAEHVLEMLTDITEHRIVPFDSVEATKRINEREATYAKP